MIYTIKKKKSTTYVAGESYIAQGLVTNSHLFSGNLPLFYQVFDKIEEYESECKEDWTDEILLQVIQILTNMGFRHLGNGLYRAKTSPEKYTPTTIYEVQIGEPK